MTSPQTTPVQGRKNMWIELVYRLVISYLFQYAITHVYRKYVKRLPNFSAINSLSDFDFVFALQRYSGFSYGKSVYRFRTTLNKLYTRPSSNIEVAMKLPHT